VKTAVILLGHGSRAAEGNTALADVAGIINEIGGVEVIPAYLQFCSPSLSESLKKAAADGAGKIIVVPYFLYSGNHVTQDIPEELETLKREHPEVEIIMTDNLGAHRKLAEIVLERIKGIE
jgi:sirohydrochlorin ferrochelatase